VCECLQHSNDLSCCSLRKLCLYILSQYGSFIKNGILKDRNDFHKLVFVQLIMKCSKEDLTSWTNDCSNRPYNSRFKADNWISPSGVDYHEVIGIVDKKHHLMVWDMGMIIPYKKYNGDNNGIISIKLTSYNNDNDDKENESFIVSWDGFTINSNTWVKIPIDYQSNINIQSNIVGSVYNYIQDQEYGQVKDNDRPPVVIVSGVANSNNPCPGVAIARFS
jgi:hypothetical protein